jgi:hypothetical protein
MSLYTTSLTPTVPCFLASGESGLLRYSQLQAALQKLPGLVQDDEPWKSKEFTPVLQRIIDHSLGQTPGRLRPGTTPYPMKLRLSAKPVSVGRHVIQRQTHGLRG